MPRFRSLALAALLAGLVAAPCRAADAHGPLPPEILEPGFYGKLLDKGLARVKKLEVVEMATAIAKGSQMGPGDGWFHPSQSRYDWKWLAARYDRDRNGKITEEEFDGPKELFRRLDRDRDGVITRADFDWSMRSRYVQQMNIAEYALRRLGADNGGKMTKEKWDREFKRISQGKDFITPEDIYERMFPPPSPESEGGDAPTPAILLRGLLQGDLGSPFAGPRVGGRAPEFRLKTHDGKKEIALSDYRGKKPVVLVFGSFT
jgi:Ca2+-binding EF-hand superfamily protein